MLFQYGQSSAALPEEITVLREVTGDADYKNRKLAALQKLGKFLGFSHKREKAHAPSMVAKKELSFRTALFKSLFLIR